MEALHGIRILDLTFFQQGPSATALLGAMGADVIKIEQPGVGDPGRGIMRGYSSIYGTPADQRNFYFEAFNRNKRGIALDLTKATGQQVLHKLVAASDVFVHNLRQQAIARLGVDYNSLKSHNPCLIYAWASGYGRLGDDADLPCLDPAALARSGFLSAISEPGRPPVFFGAGVSDQIGALTLANGILMALLAREHYGVGQEVATSLLGGMIWAQNTGISYTLTTGLQRDYHDRRHARNPLFNSYECADGKWILLAGLQADRIWPDVCKALGSEQLQDHPHFKDVESRTKFAEEVIATLGAVFLTRSRREWLAQFRLYHDIICTPIQSHTEVVQDRQALANDYILEYEHPTHGRSRVVGHPIYASATPLAIRRPEPEFGQHTEEILLEIGGFTWSEIERFRDEQVI